MPKSLRSLEGYLLVDNRCAGGALNEFPTLTCSHCKAVMLVNPLRTRDRAFCRKCNHYVCDKCEALRVASGGECKTFDQIGEEIQEAAVLAEQRGVILLP